MHSAEQYKSNYSGIREQYDAIIKQTRRMVKGMSDKQCFQKAKLHIIDALNNKQPRPVFYSQQLTLAYYILNCIQNSTIWDWLVFLLSYTFMYLVILDNQSYSLKIALQSTILVIFIFDTFIDFYCKSFQNFKRKNKYPDFYFWKSALIIIMAIDLFIFIGLPCYNSRPIRPFRILRAFIPAIFDSQTRKSLIALSSAFKDLIVFILYYSVIIGGFVILGTYTLSFDPNYSDPNSVFGYDEYKSNFNDLGKMVFQIYALATYDNYPDNQLPAVQYYQPNTIFFIVFIFLNMFLFASIPGTIFYNKFRETRSKYIIIDQIKQQHSLILAFVTLAHDQTNLTFDTLIRFLFYFYKNKIQYVQYITDICLKLDDNNNQTIQVNQFMELSKILLYNSAMFPPTNEDIVTWVQWRKYINQTFFLKKIVQHWLFDTVVSLIILLAAINSIFYIFTDSHLSYIFDSIFIWIFFVELIMRVVGIGPYKFFTERWNLIDTIMIITSVVFFFLNLQFKAANIVKMFRFFRLIVLIKIVLQRSFLQSLNNSIIDNIKNVFTTFLEIMPIIIKYFHFFAFVYYIFGILGMEIFYNVQFIQDQNVSYNIFDQYSNFKTFIGSQYIMMQILTEGSWSTVAMGYCWRSQESYGYIIALFIFMHVMIVIVIGNLLKGIFWQCYFTVRSMIDNIEETEAAYQQKQQQNQKKAEQINQINKLISKNQSFEPDSIIKRQIIQKKLDFQILKRIKKFKFYNNEQQRLKEQPFRSVNRSKIVFQIMEDNHINPNQLKQPRRKQSNHLFYHKRKTLNLHSIQEKQQIDFQEQMEQLLNRLILSPKIKYSEIIAYPQIFVKFLNQKFKKPQVYLNGDKFDLNVNPLKNLESINFHLYSMSALLGIESSTRVRKNIIVNCLSTNKLINDNTADQIMKSKHLLKKFHIDNDGAFRKMFLSETNEDLVKKVQIQYFSDVYGNSFKQINKITLEPMLKFEATLTYSLWNLLRYQQINVSDFFHLLTHIEDQMSNKLLQKGSLVKFVYKLDHESDIWFLVELKTYQELNIRFIKTGLWTYTQQLEQNTTYYAKDIFNWNLPLSSQQKIFQQYMKLFYQSFQTLAFSLSDKKSFFQTNPQYYIYDLYINNFNVYRRNRKSSFGQLKISNIMLVVLCKENQRIDVGQKNLPYQMSDIKSQRRKRKEEDFILSDQKETFQKLKNLGAKDHEKIIDNQGLPFAYILNLMKQMSDMLNLYHQHFVNQVEKALNDHYNSANQTENNEPDLISIPQIKIQIQQI